jgi:16S rRNA (uracil1498-N3)-methyltransferase
VDIGLVASLHAGARPIDEALDPFSREKGRPPASAAIVIGPEGDLSKTELQLLMDSGFRPITLGNLILRCETAALAALTLAQHELRRRHGHAS